MSCLSFFSSLGGSVSWHDLAVDPGPREALALQLLEQVGVLALAAADHRREHLVPGALRQLEQPVDDLLRALPGDRLAADRAVRRPGAGEQQPQVVVDLGDGADRRPRVAVGRLLVDRHRRRQALDEVDVGLVHLAEELPRVGRQRLDVAALALGEDRVERQRGLARPGQPGEDDQRVTRELDRRRRGGCARGHPATMSWSCWGRRAGTAEVTRPIVGGRTDSARPSRPRAPRRCSPAAYSRRMATHAATAHRGVRRARRHRDRRPGQPRRVHRLAVPAPVRLDGLLRARCWAPRSNGRWLLGPLGAATEHPALPRELVRARDRSHETDTGAVKVAGPHAARRRPGRHRPQRRGPARHGRRCGTSGSSGSTTARCGRGCRTASATPATATSSARSPGPTCCVLRGSRLPQAHDGHHEDEFEVAGGRDPHLLD